MECPKCHGRMQEKTLSTLSGSVTIDKCVACHGLWFDLGEAEILKDKWMSEHIDDSGTILSQQHYALRDIDCPRCGVRMTPVSDPSRNISSMRPVQPMACTSTPVNSQTSNMKH